MMMRKAKIAFILGIRPDIIRAALILKHLREYPEIETVFIWSGQHYSDNLKGIFFRELGVAAAEIDLGCAGNTDAEVVASLISRLYTALESIRPETCVFLGDTNTTAGAIACAQLNIPIVHIEGCMRSYDWRMPEEKYRTLIDHLADIIYAYFPEYKEQGVREGIAADKIIVVGNPIVDVLDHYYFSQKDKFERMASDAFFADRKIQRGRYYLMTCHRRENVHNPDSIKAILKLAGDSPYTVFFPASYRTQRVLQEMNLILPKRLLMVDPIGYEEMLCLLVNSRGCITDSGTVVEETCVLQVPSVQMRKSTERPQVYDAKSSVKFDPTEISRYPSEVVFRKLDGLYGKKWAHNLGDGNASRYIAESLRALAQTGGFHKHGREDYPFSVDRSYTDDGL